MKLAPGWGMDGVHGCTTLRSVIVTTPSLFGLRVPLNTPEHACLSPYTLSPPTIEPQAIWNFCSTRERLSAVNRQLPHRKPEGDSVMQACSTSLSGRYARRASGHDRQAGKARHSHIKRGTPFANGATTNGETASFTHTNGEPPFANGVRYVRCLFANGGCVSCRTAFM